LAAERVEAEKVASTKPFNLWQESLRVNETADCMKFLLKNILASNVITHFVASNQQPNPNIVLSLLRRMKSRAVTIQ